MGSFVTGAVTSKIGLHSLSVVVSGAKWHSRRFPLWRSQAEYFALEHVALSLLKDRRVLIYLGCRVFTLLSFRRVSLLEDPSFHLGGSPSSQIQPRCFSIRAPDDQWALENGSSPFPWIPPNLLVTYLSWHCASTFGFFRPRGKFMEILIYFEKFVNISL